MVSAGGDAHIALALILPAIILIAASYLRGRIYTTLKHPMLAGLKLWALAHLLANGDLGSMLLFGSLLGWAVYDRISLKHRSDPGAPPIPVGGAATTCSPSSSVSSPISRWRLCFIPSSSAFL